MLFYIIFSISFVISGGNKQKLEKLQDGEQIEKPFIRKQMKIRFPERGRSGRSVVTVKGLEFGFENEVINLFDMK